MLKSKMKKIIATLKVKTLKIYQQTSKEVL